MGKRIGAGLVGWLVFAAISVTFFIASGRNSHAEQSTAFMIASGVVGLIAAGLGGFVASRMAPRSARFVAMFIAIGAIGSMLGSNQDPKWSQTIALVLCVPAALLGGWMVERRRVMSS
jgi:heme A synthase